MQPLVQMRDVWTVEDLQTLDVEDWHRYEIVDGALLVSPTPGVPHEKAIGKLHRALLRSVPDQILVLSGNLGISFSRSYRVADIVLIHDIESRADHVGPDDVLLAVEVMSPGSVTSDRLVKPAQYAAAGIVNFWRVELDPVSLTAYQLPLGADVYVEVGTWGAGESVRLDRPFRFEIEIDRLT